MIIKVEFYTIETPKGWRKVKKGLFNFITLFFISTFRRPHIEGDGQENVIYSSLAFYFTVFSSTSQNSFN